MYVCMYVCMYVYIITLYDAFFFENIKKLKNYKIHDETFKI